MLDFKNIFPSLEASVCALLFEKMKKLIFKRGEFVYQNGDGPKGLYFVESGLIGLTIIGQDSGREHLLRFFKCNQFFGHRSLFSEDVYHANAVALDRTEVLFLEKSVLLFFLEQHPVLYKDFLVSMGKELKQAENHRILVLENQMLQKTAQALIYLKNLKPDRNWTRQEIANFISSTPSTVIKTLADLESIGVIRQSGRSIEILDQDALLEI